MHNSVEYQSELINQLGDTITSLERANDDLKFINGILAGYLDNIINATKPVVAGVMATNKVPGPELATLIDTIRIIAQSACPKK